MYTVIIKNLYLKNVGVDNAEYFLILAVVDVLYYILYVNVLFLFILSRFPFALRSHKSIRQQIGLSLGS